MDQAEYDELDAALRKTGALDSCKQCGHQNVHLIDGYLTSVLEPAPNVLSVTPDPLNSRLFPMVSTSCERCGYVTLHALGALRIAAGLPPFPVSVPREVGGHADSRATHRY